MRSSTRTTAPPMLTIDKIVAAIPQISTDARYWFVRTDGGSLYAPFIASQTIAIGYPKIGLALVPADLTAEGIKTLKTLVAKLYPEKKHAGVSASQLLTFQRVMKPGDYVLVPSAGTSRITIGMLTKKPPFEAPLKYDGKDYPEFTKRRSVNWIKTVRRSDLNPNILKILNTHQTIVEASDYAAWIDPLLFDIFRKGDTYHYSLDVRKKEHINARVLFPACLEMFKLVDEFAAQEHFHQDASDIDTKINLNSPGKIELITKASRFICAAALLVILLNGGGFEMKSDWLKLDVNIHSDGIIKKFNDFLNDRSRRGLRDSLTEKIAALQIQNPEQLQALLQLTDTTALAQIKAEGTKLKQLPDSPPGKTLK